MTDSEPGSIPVEPDPQFSPGTTPASWCRRSQIHSDWHRLDTEQLLEQVECCLGLPTDANGFVAKARSTGDPHGIVHQWLQAAGPALYPSDPDASQPTQEEADTHDMLWEAAVVLWERLLPDIPCPETVARELVSLLERDSHRSTATIRTPEVRFLTSALEDISPLIESSRGPFGVVHSEFFDLVEEYLDDVAAQVTEWLIELPARLFICRLTNDSLHLAKDLALCLDAPDLLVDRVRMLAQLGRTLEAVAGAEDIPRLFPDSFGLLRMGISLAELGDRGEAERLYRAVLTSRPTVTRERREARELLARLLEDDGRELEARALRRSGRHSAPRRRPSRTRRQPRRGPGRR